MELSPLPRHVAFIMDGNRRWAQERGLPLLEGYSVGVENIRKVSEALFFKYGIKYITLFGFSTENWDNRPRREIKWLFHLMERGIDRDTQYYLEKGVRFIYLGKMSNLSKKLQAKIGKVVEVTRNSDKFNLCIAFDYGSREEIVEAVRRLLVQGFSPEKLDPAVFEQYLYTAGLPEPDLVIRTGGELRLSNFLLWQSAYSELYFTPVYWPDFDDKGIEEALLAYSKRQRRFGA